MQAEGSLKAIERRAYSTTFEDGFYEMLWGGLFLLFAWIPILESVGIPRFYSYPSILILAIIPWIGKRCVTIPRLGAVEFGEKRKARRRYTMVIGGAVVVLMIPVVIMMFAPGFPGNLTWETVALILAPAIAVGVFLMDHSKIYIYAVLFFFSIAAAEFLLDYIDVSTSNLIAFGIPGVVLAAYGFFLLFRFLKKYPKPTAEASDVSR